MGVVQVIVYRWRHVHEVMLIGMESDLEELVVMGMVYPRLEDLGKLIGIIENLVLSAFAMWEYMVVPLDPTVSSDDCNLLLVIEDRMLDDFESCIDIVLSMEFRRYAAGLCMIVCAELRSRCVIALQRQWLLHQ